MSWRLVEGACGGLLLVVVGAGRAVGQSAPAEPLGSLLLGVTLNERELADPVVVVQSSDGFLAEESAVHGWRLLVPEGAVTMVSGRRYVALAGLPGVSSTFDGARQVLRLKAPPEAFEGQRLDAVAPGAAPRTAAVNAAFISYSVVVARGGVTSQPLGADAFVQAGASGEWGLFTSTQILRAGAVGEAAVRLDTSYVRDDPVRMRRLSVGDALTAGSSWVQPARFAGVRYGTAFDLQPSLVTFPVPAFLGRTAVPSDVELYVNDVLRYRGAVDAGPFAIAGAPLITGAGQVSLQVRDALGVQHAVASTYYVAPSLLRPGLSDVSFEAGVERRRYGIRSFDYGPPFAAASLRRGVTDWLTLEARAEAGAHTRDAGVGADLLVSTLGELNAAVGVSSGRKGAGAVVQAGFSRVTPLWSLSASWRHATPEFRQVGSGDGDTADTQIRDQAQVAGGATFGSHGAVTAAYTVVRTGSQPRTRIASITYSLRAFGRAFLNIFMLHSHIDRERGDTRLGFSLTVPFGRQASVYAEAQGDERTLEVRSAPPTDDGFGTRVAIREGARDTQEADLTYRGRAGEATIQASHSAGGTDVRLLVSGALVVIGGQVAPTRQLNGGFALVETLGAPGVQVFAENRPVTRTNRAGVAIVTDLRPYEANRIRVDATDLPIEAWLASDTMVVTPAPLGGARARFGLALNHPAILVLRDPSGDLIAPGSPARIDGGEQLYTGYGGELFAAFLRAGAFIEVEGPGGRCRATAPALPAGGGIPRLDPVVCRLLEATP